MQIGASSNAEHWFVLRHTRGSRLARGACRLRASVQLCTAAGTDEGGSPLSYWMEEVSMDTLAQNLQRKKGGRPRKR